MEKDVFVDSRAKKEFEKFNISVQNKFNAYIKILKNEGKLEKPYSKKIDKQLFELRVKKDKGLFRGFYAYFYKNLIIILHYFQKKTPKTPLKNIKTAKRRLKNYE